jgi:hemerythrin-like domain-containing protein
VKKLFQLYDRAKGRLTKQAIADQVCAALEMHAQLEETIFYPVFAHVADDTEDVLVENALQEHQTVKDLIEDLEDAHDAEFDAIFRELRQDIEAHIQEEEQTLFPKAEELLAAHMEKLTAEMRKFQKQGVAS